MRRDTHWLAVLVVLALSGCAERASPAPPAADSSLAAPAIPRSIGDRVDSPAPARAAPLALALDPEGLRAVEPPSGSTRAIAFGEPQTKVIAALEALRGAPDERGRNPECGAGPLDYATWGDGLRLWFSDGRFVGWGVDGRAEGADRITTMAGVGAGSSLAELRDVYDAQVQRTSLGKEFDAGGLHGVLDGEGPEARVTHLWAGTVCIFR